MVAQSSRVSSLHVVVVANGEFVRPERQSDLVRAADLVIAVDGGANWLIAMGLTAHILVGDLDSASPEAQRALRGAPACCASLASRTVRHQAARPTRNRRSTDESRRVPVRAIGGSWRFLL